MADDISPSAGIALAIIVLTPLTWGIIYALRHRKDIRE